jgi:NAD(P)-dependent dehydrogenase (short-subunit alcohol dehydrogenase family)
MRLQGKAAIVTGGAGAIGAAIARLLAKEGCDVGLLDVIPAGDVASDIRLLGRRAVETVADISCETQVTSSISHLVSELGYLDILVNAAGIISSGPAASLAGAEWDRVLAINLTGVFLCCQATISPLKSRGAGRIINIGSILGKNGGNARPWIDPGEQERSGNVAYGVSKAGVHALSLYLARELAAFGITVNVVAPGPIATSMTTAFPEKLKALIPLGRLGNPQEVAAAVCFLASEDAGFITGEVLDINGGAWAD